MFRKVTLLSTILLAALVSTATAQPKPPSGNDETREADRAEIKAHIEGITQAFIDGDIEKIFSTHTEDWRGFLESTQVPIRGIDEYMRANGISWPPPANGASNANPGLSNPNAGKLEFKISDFDVHFYGPDLAVACFMLDFGRKSATDFITTNRLRIMDVYVRRNGHWIQGASHTVVDPTWRSNQTSMPGRLPDRIRKQLLEAREAVWRAWFTNDQVKLKELVPEDVITIEASETWGNRSSILEDARRFAAGGNKLTRLEFPRTEIQAYGRTFIIYTTYLFELEKDGQKSTSTGRATEIFVMRDGKFVNTGWHLDSGK